MRDEARRGSMDGDIDTDGCVYRLGFNGRVFLIYYVYRSNIGFNIGFEYIYAYVWLLKLPKIMNRMIDEDTNLV